MLTDREEAAILDGASYWGRFWHIILPLSTNALTALGIFVFLAAIASAGWGLGLFFFYLGAVMLHAYAVDDRVVTPREDEGEEY